MASWVAEADPASPRRTAMVTEFLERTPNLSENLVVLANQSTLGGSLPEEVPPCLLGPFWSDCSVMTCSQNSRQDQRWQTGETTYSEQMLFYILVM